MRARSPFWIGIVIGALGAAGAACNALMDLDKYDPTYHGDTGGAGGHGGGTGGQGGGTGGQGGQGGQGGDAGGGGECTTADDCPPTGTECVAPVCVGGKCGTYILVGMPSAAQTAGDCVELRCNGQGGLEGVEDTSDIPNDGHECTEDVCNGNMPANPLRPTGTLCSGGLCDGTNQDCSPCNAGNCYECAVCALAGPCAMLKTMCLANPECANFVSCIAPCTMQAPGQGQGCFDTCAINFPAGATEYQAVLRCAVCTTCSCTPSSPGPLSSCQ